MLSSRNQNNRHCHLKFPELCMIWLGIVCIPFLSFDMQMVEQHCRVPVGELIWSAAYASAQATETATPAQAANGQAFQEKAPKRPPKQSLKKVSRRLYRLRSEKLYEPLIFRAARKYQVDPALVKAIIKAESGFNPEALSHRGAVGLMQLMPRTAKSLGVEDCFNPVHNINGGVKYFSQLLERFEGDVRLALAAYNAGSRHVRNYGGIPPFKATHIYVKKVIEYYQSYKKQLTSV